MKVLLSICKRYAVAKLKYEQKKKTYNLLADSIIGLKLVDKDNQLREVFPGAEPQLENLLMNTWTLDLHIRIKIEHNIRI